MIKYNSNTINDWYFDTSDIIKVYRNNAVCYYKITTSGGTPSQTPCYAVVDDISQYSDTEFEDVFNKADEKWYKLNNLNQYEEYGIYGSGRNITYYEGKLTIDNGYEYQYSGGSWVNLGEVSGGTASLPNVPFTVNYNAKNYDSQTKTLLKTSGQLADVDAVITAGTPTVNDGYLTIASGTRATISGYQTYFNRDNNNPNLTIISKQRTDGSNCHMFANRDSNYNWMYRCYSTKLTLHGASEQGSVAVTTQPVIESVRIDSSRQVRYNNYANNTSSTYSNFKYGGTNSGKFAMFQGYATTTGENFVGDFYWVYMSQNTLTDEQVQQVIAYNEGGGGQPEYPLYYDEMQDPPNNLSFSSMTEAEAYECPWVGMKATIDGVKYVFSGDSQSGYEWVYNPSRLPSGYTEVEYISSENVSESVLGPYIDTNYKPTQNTRIVFDYQSTSSTRDYQRIFGSGEFDMLGYLVNLEGAISNRKYYYKFGQTSSWYTTSVSADLNRHTIDYNNSRQFLLDNTSIATLPNTSFTCTSNLGIFWSINTKYTTNPINLIGRVYSCQVYDNGTLVRDLVPCINPSSTVGMYDIVNDVFYSSANNYSFTAGNPV